MKKCGFCTKKNGLGHGDIIDSLEPGGIMSMDKDGKLIVNVKGENAYFDIENCLVCGKGIEKQEG